MVRNTKPPGQRARGYGPSGEPGTSKRKAKPNYQENKEARKQQACPASPRGPVIKGPTKHPKSASSTSGPEKYGHQNFIIQNPGATRDGLGM